MVGSQLGPPVVVIPEPLDRRMRMGPFPSAQDALKFFGYATTGALLSPFVSPWVWLPIVLVGFGISVWRPDGQALDERLLRFVSWELRRSSQGWILRQLRPHPLVRRGFLQLASHRYVTVVRSGGIPVAYLPADELARRFELYRELLRSVESSFSFLATTSPIRYQTIRPRGVATHSDEAMALAGYSELGSLLCRRRRLRRVYFVLGTDGNDTESVGQLEGRVTALVEGLSHLGLHPVRLRDRELAEASHRFGWPEGEISTS